MKKVILRCANGLGNQMFLYAFAYVVSQKLNRILKIDTQSGFSKKLYFKNKREIKYALNIFNISASRANKNECFNSFLKNIKRKFLKKIDIFKTKKLFINENKYQTNTIIYNKLINNKLLNDSVYIEGYFQSANYFKEFRNELINEFKIKKKVTPLIKYKSKILSSNSVALAIRSDRFNEQVKDINKKKIVRSLQFEHNQVTYINRAIKYFKNELNKPIFFLFSDSPSKFNAMFKKEKNLIIIEKHNKNKIYEDYYLMSLCKHFAVAPTAFNFWPAWLCNYDKKICLRPKNLNPSNNKAYWPREWEAI